MSWQQHIMSFYPCISFNFLNTHYQHLLFYHISFFPSNFMSPPQTHYCSTISSEPSTFVSAVLLVTSSMLRLGLPHVNVLSKVRICNTILTYLTDEDKWWMRNSEMTACSIHSQWPNDRNWPVLDNKMHIKVLFIGISMHASYFLAEGLVLMFLVLHSHSFFLCLLLL